MGNPVFKRIRASIGAACISRTNGNNRIARDTGGGVVDFHGVKYYFLALSFLLFTSIEVKAQVEAIGSPDPGCSGYGAIATFDGQTATYDRGFGLYFGQALIRYRIGKINFNLPQPFGTSDCTAFNPALNSGVFVYSYLLGLAAPCPSGQIDIATNACYVPPVVCPPNSTPSGSTCVCNAGYQPVPVNGLCVPDEQFTLTLEGLATELEPSGTAAGNDKSLSMAFVRVADAQTGAPKSGAQVKIVVDVNANSGGHAHHDTNRPKGALGSVGGNACGSAPQPASCITLTTDPNGEAHFTFTAPQASGIHTITATCISPTCSAPATGNIDVKVAGLVPLSSTSSIYQLVGVTNTHALNQYLTPEAVDVARRLAILYQEEFPSSPLLRYNDASLPYGGVFDICTSKETTAGCRLDCQLQADGTYTCSWNKPHKEHRRGTVLDIRANNDTATAIPRRNDGEFRRIARELKANPGKAPHSPNSPTNRHWHVRLLGANE